MMRRRRSTFRILGPALRFRAVTKHADGEIVAGTVMMLTGEVVEAVKTRLAEIRLSSANRSGHDRAEFMNRMLSSSTWGGVVVVVLFLTLGSLCVRLSRSPTAPRWR